MTVPVQSIEVTRVTRLESEQRADLLVVEEPLEIRIGFGPATDRQQRKLSVTMRTPGNDIELALGFLLTEGIITNFSEIASIRHCVDARQSAKENVIRAELMPEVNIDFEKLQRHFYTSSSCGVCGKTSIEAVKVHCEPVTSSLTCAATVIQSLPSKIKSAQPLFEQTGGIHASALFTQEGELELLREDVGRHNALDKIIGNRLAQGLVPLIDSILLVSGRASFELVQKACVAGIPIMVAIGAPSSLAVEMARANRMTLIGFAKSDRFNVYCGHERVADPQAISATR